MKTIWVSEEDHQYVKELARVNALTIPKCLAMILEERRRSEDKVAEKERVEIATNRFEVNHPSGCTCYFCTVVGA